MLIIVLHYLKVRVLRVDKWLSLLLYEWNAYRRVVLGIDVFKGKALGYVLCICCNRLLLQLTHLRLLCLFRSTKEVLRVVMERFRREQTF